MIIIISLHCLNFLSTEVYFPGFTQKFVLVWCMIALSEAEVIGQATVIFLGGYETTSTTLQFLTHNLALYHEIQEKVVEEIKVQLGDVSHSLYFLLYRRTTY